MYAFDNDFLVELSETSDNRPFNTISTTEIHTTPHNTNIQIHDPNELLSDTSESQVRYSHQSPQTTQTIIRQPPIVYLEIFSFQNDDNHNNDNDQMNFKIQILHLILNVQISQLIQLPY